jgi:hypothetical protein
VLDVVSPARGHPPVGDAPGRSAAEGGQVGLDAIGTTRVSPFCVLTG